MEQAGRPTNVMNAIREKKNKDFFDESIRTRTGTVLLKRETLSLSSSASGISKGDNPPPLPASLY